jgi:hypothetical protein
MTLAFLKLHDAMEQTSHNLILLSSSFILWNVKNTAEVMLWELGCVSELKGALLVIGVNWDT